MILLAVDVRNNLTTIGVFDGEELIGRWRISSHSGRTADEWQVALESLLRQGGVDRVEGVSLSCTVPSIMADLRASLDRYYSDTAVSIVEPGTKTGVPILTDNPREVGADRVVNSLAVNALYGGPAIVVDFGTATTFDVVDARGRYIGGAIAPGVEISLEALTRKGAQLRAVELTPPRSVIGKTTGAAMQSGVVYGFAGLVDGIVDRILDELDEDDVPVVATGHAAEVVAKECETVTAFERDLTLTGLRLVHAKNH